MKRHLKPGESIRAGDLVEILQLRNPDDTPYAKVITAKREVRLVPNRPEFRFLDMGEEPEVGDMKVENPPDGYRNRARLVRESEGIYDT
jgi:hypothetical protein